MLRKKNYSLSVRLFMEGAALRSRPRGKGRQRCDGEKGQGGGHGPATEMDGGDGVGKGRRFDTTIRFSHVSLTRERTHGTRHTVQSIDIH